MRKKKRGKKKEKVAKSPCAEREKEKRSNTSFYRSEEQGEREREEIWK